MNPVLHEAAHNAPYGWVVGVVTLVFIVVFVSWVWWLFARTNRKRFDDAARLPLANGDEYE